VALEDSLAMGYVRFGGVRVSAGRTILG
jgi:hypothetical protein